LNFNPILFLLHVLFFSIQALYQPNDEKKKKKKRKPRISLYVIEENNPVHRNKSRWTIWSMLSFERQIASTYIYTSISLWLYHQYSEQINFSSMIVRD